MYVGECVSRMRYIVRQGGVGMVVCVVVSDVVRRGEVLFRL